MATGDTWAVIHHQEPDIQGRLRSLIEEAVEIEDANREIGWSHIVKIVGPHDTL